TTPRSRTASRPTATRTTTTKARASTTKTDDSIVARTGRTIKERPYTSAAIATGAVTVVAAAAAAGAFLVSRRDKSFKQASEELTGKVKDGFASASETVKGGLSSATDTVKDLGQRSAAYFKGNGSETGSETRTQQQIAEEALTLKETGAAKSPVDELSATEIKTGAIAY
ncbi:MAG: hypothetical protein M3Q15_01775, partial [Pseudomonadota bacterium]|nr:hypothetical protein [Pseudomonadota bacterium]